MCTMCRCSFGRYLCEAPARVARPGPVLTTTVPRAGSAQALQSSVEKSILLLTLLTQWDKYPCHHILPFTHFSNHNFLLISHDVNALMERNNPMLLLQHERCYLSLLMAKYLCQRKFTADHLVLTINTVTMIYSMERSSRSTMGLLLHLRRH